MAEVKLYKLSVTGKELDEKLNQISQNLKNITDNFNADEEFKTLVAATYATKEELSKLFENDTEKIDSIVEIINLLDSKVNAAEVASLLNEKADKSELNDYQPKGNYLTEHQDLSNYATIEYVSQRIHELLNGVDAEHDTLKEIVDLLNDKQDAAEFISSLQTKADKTDLDNYQLVGDYATKEDLENYQPVGNYLTEHQDLSSYATKAELDNYQVKGEYLTNEDLEGYVKTEDLPEIPSIEGLATETYVDEKVSSIIDNAPEALNTLNEIVSELEKKQDATDLINILATKADKSELEPLAIKSAVTEEIDNAIANLHIDDKLDVSYLDTLATKDNIPKNISELTNDANYISEHQSLEGYATETYVNQKISDLIAGADENLDTLKEIADAINGKETAINEINTILGYKANEEDVYDKTAADDKFVDKAKYDELNDKYTTLFNVVYSNATGETATALNADYVANNLSNENTSVEITEGELGDVTIPETTKAMSVTAPMQDNSTVTLSSPKPFTLINTSDEPVNITIDAPAGTSIPTMSLSGDFEDLTVNNGTISAKSGADPLTATNVTVDNEIGKNVSISGIVFNDNATITTTSVPSLGVANNNTDQDAPNATINAENSTVTLYKGQWNSLNSNVSDETLIVTGNAHINTLNVVKGNVVVYDREVANRIDNVVNNTEYTVSLRTADVTTGAEINSALTGNPGVVNMKNDISRGRITWGIFGAGNYLLDLQGHTLTISDTLFGIMARNLVNLKIVDTVGGGKFISDKSCGLWAGENTVITVDVPESTEIIGVTHTLYCEGSGKPAINVVNGTYKLLVSSKETDVYDANGNYKFMLNHYDATYTREGNCFNITGGIFYGFDPARMNGDPGAEYSMIDLNEYESWVVDTFVDSRGTTMNVYKVVKK